MISLYSSRQGARQTRSVSGCVVRYLLRNAEDPNRSTGPHGTESADPPCPCPAGRLPRLTLSTPPRPALAWQVYHTAFPHTALLGRVPGSSVYRNVKQYPNAEVLPPRWCLFRTSVLTSLVPA